MRGKVWQKKKKIPNYYFLFCVFVTMTLFLKYLRHQVFGSFALFTDDTKCLSIIKSVSDWWNCRLTCGV